VTERSTKVRDETCPSEPFVSERAAICGNSTRISRLVTRFWAEAALVAIAVLLWSPRLSGPLSLKWDASTYYVLGTALA
jgi:hypothetical protein